MNEKISAFLAERIAANDFPSAVYLVAEKGEIVFQDALGYAVVEPERIEARPDTIYDLASLTKPLVTGLLYAKLFGEEGLEDGIAIDLRDSHPNFHGIHFRSPLSLLTHTSGLPAWRPFYLLVKERREILGQFLEIAPEAVTPRVVYSDLNFIALMFLIEAAAGCRIDVVAGKEIVEPLGLKDTWFNPPAELKIRTAASEKGNEYERRTCVELGYLDDDGVKSPPAHADGSDLLRDRLIWGEVHDGNAWFMGGAAGHAGLFSTAEEVFKIALQFLPNYTTLLKPETTELFRTNFTLGMNEARSLAFQLAETPGSTAGSRMSPSAFGHLGFTGTSLWIDPVTERIFILLTNRTHAHDLPFVNINAVRRRFHDLANEALDANK
ncbi:MAG: serine hydrolase domain-containing protein [Pyrinomonadaceae bacterium]